MRIRACVHLLTSTHAMAGSAVHTPLLLCAMRGNRRLLDLGIPAGTIGVWSGVYSMGFSIAGSLAGGYIARMMPLLSAISWTLGIRVVPQIMRLWVAAAFVSTTSSPETPLLDHGFIVTTMCAEAFVSF